MAEAAEIFVTVKGRDVGLNTLLSQVEKKLDRMAATSTRAENVLEKGLSRAQIRASSEALRLAQSHARVEAAAGNYEGAIRRLYQALNSVDVVDVKIGNSLRAQINRYHEAAAAAMKRAEAEEKAAMILDRLRDFTQEVIGFTAIGAATTGMQEFARFMADSNRIYRETVQAENQLRALAGSTELYKTALSAASQQQVLFGGTLAENIEGISSLVTVARESGADLGQLLDISQRLALKSPDQGILGARTALSEAFSGDIQSLAMRFEIPREAIRALADSSVSASDKLRILDEYLNQIGITSEAVSGSIPESTKAINELSQAWEQAQRDFGASFDDVVTDAARGATWLLDWWNVVRGISEEVTSRMATTQLLSLPPELQSSLANVSSYFRELLGVTEASTEASQRAGGTWMTTAESIKNAADAAVQAAAAEKAAAVGDQVLEESKKQLANQALATAQAIINSGGDIEAIASRLAASSNQVDVLTAAYMRLLAVQQAAKIAGQARLMSQAANTVDLTGGRGITIGGPGRAGTGDVDAAIARMNEFKRAQEAAAVASRNQAFALADQAGQIRILQNELSQLTPGTAEYINKQTELFKLQMRTGRAASAARRRSINDQKTYQSESLRLAQEYHEKLAKIDRDAFEKMEQARKRFQQQQYDARYSFYRSLESIEDPRIGAEISARYEAAASEAATIRDSRGADAAAAYLEAVQRALMEEARLRAEIAEAESEGQASKAEYYRGLLKLQQEAAANELNMIREQGSEIANERARQYAEAEAAYNEHLAKMAAIYLEKTKQLPGFAATLPSPTVLPPSTMPVTVAPMAPVVAATIPTNTVTLVSDPETHTALESASNAIITSLSDVVERIDTVASYVRDVERAIGNIRGRLLSGG